MMETNKPAKEPPGTSRYGAVASNCRHTEKFPGLAMLTGMRRADPDTTNEGKETVYEEDTIG